MKNDKVLLELYGLSKSNTTSIEVTIDLTNTLVKLISDRIKKTNPAITREQLNKQLRHDLYIGRRDV